MLVPLGASELDDLLATAMERSQKAGFSIYLPLFLTLYEHGFRVRELKHAHTWEVLPGDLVSASTFKGGSNRLVPLAAFPPLVQLSIMTGENQHFSFSYSAAEKVLNRFLPVAGLQVLSKGIALHAFRHNYVKRLVGQGISRESIRSLMGLTELSTVDHYADSVIFKVIT